MAGRRLLGHLGEVHRLTRGPRGPTARRACPLSPSPSHPAGPSGRGQGLRSGWTRGDLRVLQRLPVPLWPLTGPHTATGHTRAAFVAVDPVPRAGPALPRREHRVLKAVGDLVPGPGPGTCTRSRPGAGHVSPPLPPAQGGA